MNEPVTWDPDTGPSRLRAALAARGYARVVLGDVAREAALAPWPFVERLLGAAPRMVERQPIRAVPGGRSFASSQGYTPLHTDSQLFLGAPPDVQVMVCARAADSGGESLLFDGWALLDAVAREDPALHRALFDLPRRIPFVFGDVFGPTVALRGGALALTHSPMALPADPVHAAVCARLRGPTTLPVARGEVLVLDNRRMLHGRNAFDDTRREFVRLLAWMPAPLGAHPGHTARASQVARAAPSSDPAVRARFGLAPMPDAEAARRMRVVTAMLQGVAPGALAAREGVAEAVLYQWRDAALSAAAQALADAPAEDVSSRCAALLA
jgi:hypothetical protein